MTGKMGRKCLKVTISSINDILEHKCRYFVRFSWQIDLKRFIIKTILLYHFVIDRRERWLAYDE